MTQLSADVKFIHIKIKQYICYIQCPVNFASPMEDHHSTAGKRAVSIWLYTGVAMLLIQVILGGITRLTGSGLSITEWNVITGTLPPLSETQWVAEFDKYRETPQFQYLNVHFTLDDFKFIFFWEWLHRFWARLIGIVFVAGLIYLVAKRKLDRKLLGPLFILFLLGALQGTIGWIMVASGLTGDAIYVKPTKLALHFIFALVLIGYAFWVAISVSISRSATIDLPRARTYSWVLMALVTVQLIFGALMAGHKAANAAPTWPDVNGSYAPQALFATSPIGRDLVENKITIHFVHRNLAYLIAVIVLVGTFAVKPKRTYSAFTRVAMTAPVVLVLIQILLGILSVITSRNIVPNEWGIFEWMAQLHQVVGMMFFLSFVLLLFAVSNKRLTGHQ
jgi:heme a synthase